MKKPSVFSFLISLLLFTAVCAQVIPVIDNDGNPVKIGEKYFIKPVKTASNNGGGLVPAAINILPICPLGITQTLLPDEPGVHVSFGFPYYTPEKIVHTYTPLNIKFESDIWPVCNEFSKVWEVDVSSSAAQEAAILIGGKPGDDNSEFTIKTAGEGAGANTYKLTNSYPLNTSSTGTVGTTPGAWSAPQLVITNDDSKTLLFKFYKYHVPTTATTSTSRVEKLGLRMFPFY